MVNTKHKNLENEYLQKKKNDMVMIMNEST